MTGSGSYYFLKGDSSASGEKPASCLRKNTLSPTWVTWRCLASEPPTLSWKPCVPSRRTAVWAVRVGPPIRQVTHTRTHTQSLCCQVLIAPWMCAGAQMWLWVYTTQQHRSNRKHHRFFYFIFFLTCCQWGDNPETDWNICFYWNLPLDAQADSHKSSLLTGQVMFRRLYKVEVLTRSAGYCLSTHRVKSERSLKHRRRGQTSRSV